MTTQTQLSESVVRDLMTALAVGAAPDVRWIDGDGLCDCTFQRLGEWSNPYLAATLRVRLCCIWETLYQQYPQYVQRIDAYYDGNRETYVAEPREWDNPSAPMPVSYWHRQLAKQQGKTLDQIRREYAGREHERPQARPDRVQDTPTAAEMRAALEQRLRDATWILPDEELNPLWPV